MAKNTIEFTAMMDVWAQLGHKVTFIELGNALDAAGVEIQHDLKDKMGLPDLSALLELAIKKTGQ